MTLDAVRRTLAKALGAGMEVDLLLMQALHCPRSFLYAHPEYVPSAEQAQQLRAAAERRLAGCPLAYILHTAPFMEYEFHVTEDVLIPRADTETLVQAALPLCAGSGDDGGGAGGAKGGGARVLELCTGSGCVAIAVSLHCPRALVFASDISAKALDVARENAARYGAPVTFWQSDYFTDLPDDPPFDVILANPPYISAGEMRELSPEVRAYEPQLALYGGEDGLDAYRILLRDAPRYLTAGGRMLLEIGYRQAAAVTALARDAGFTKVEVVQDTGGRDRVVQMTAMQGRK